MQDQHVDLTGTTKAARQGHPLSMTRSSLKMNLRSVLDLSRESQTAPDKRENWPDQRMRWERKGGLSVPRQVLVG